MIFKECYRKEVSKYVHDITLDKRILNSMEEKKQSRRAVHFRVGIAVALFTVVIMNWGSIAGYARSLYGQFSLLVGKEVISMSEIVPVKMNVEGHKTYEGTGILNDTMYSCTYESEAIMTEYAGIVIPRDNELRFGWIAVAYSEKAKTLHMTIQVFWESEEYIMNARGIVEGHEGMESGYGVEIKPYYVYEYADGRNAYFVKERGEEIQTIYFVENGMMYQLAVEKTEEGKQIGKEIVDAMAVDKE